MNSSFLRFTFLLIFVSLIVFGQRVKTPQTPPLEKMDRSEIASVRSRFAGLNTQTIRQASAAIEVVGSGYGPTRIVFKTIKPLEPGSAVTFVLNMQDENFVPMAGYRIPSSWDPEWCSLYIQMWRGDFPDMWPGGWTTFGAIVQSPKGDVSYTSAKVLVHVCCEVGGPIIKAEVSAKDDSINITGRFGDGDIYVVLNGETMTPKRSPTDKNVVTISLLEPDKYFGYGQLPLVVCSDGECSTRMVYVPLKY